MSKIKLLSGVVIALLFLNLGILMFLFLPKSKRLPKEIIIEKLHFDKNQVIAYEDIIKIHRKTITDLDDSIRKSKNELYQLLNSKNIDLVQKEKLFEELADYQKQIEITHFNHFLEIKKICKKEQLTDYKNLTEELSRIFSNKPRPKH